MSNRSSARVSVVGPLLSVREIGPQRDVLEIVFGMACAEEAVLDRAASASRYGVDRPCRRARMETPGSSSAVELVQFDPVADTAIRDGAQGVDTDAFKVVDFMTTDFDRALEAVRQAGFEPEGIAHYEVPDQPGQPGSRFSEAHVHVDDGIVYAVLGMHDAPHSDFLRVTDRLFGEVLGFSFPVAEPEEVPAFYEALGLTEVYGYSFESEAFGAMIGAGKTATLVGRNFATDKRDPMIGVIHYGLPAGKFDRLGGRAHLPHRGIAGVVLRTVESRDEIAARALAGGGRLDPNHWCDPSRPADVVRLLGPNGILHLVEFSGGESRAQDPSSIS